MCNGLVKYLVLVSTKEPVLVLYSLLKNSGIGASLLFILHRANTLVSSHLLGIQKTPAHALTNTVQHAHCDGTVKCVVNRCA